MTVSARVHEEAAPRHPDDRVELEIDYLTYSLLTSDVTRRMIEATPSQMRALDRAFGHSRIVLSFDRRDEKLDRLLREDGGPHDVYPQFMSEILVDAQLEWLRQVEFQFRTAEFFDSFGLLHPAVSKALQLSNGQRKAIAHLVQDYRAVKREVDDDLTTELTKLDRQLRESLWKLLSDDQRQRIESYLGKNEVGKLGRPDR